MKHKAERSQSFYHPRVYKTTKILLRERHPQSSVWYCRFSERCSGPQISSVIFWLVEVNFLNWRLIALQCGMSFCGRTK